MLCDLGVGESVGDQGGDPPFGRGQAGPPRGGASASSPVLSGPRDGVVEVETDAACGHLSDGANADGGGGECERVGRGGVGRRVQVIPETLSFCGCGRCQLHRAFVTPRVRVAECDDLDGIDLADPIAQFAGE